jgi:hypothetical protein
MVGDWEWSGDGEDWFGSWCAQWKANCRMNWRSDLAVMMQIVMPVQRLGVVVWKQVMILLK